MKKLVVANWKMNPRTVHEARTLASQIEHGLLLSGRRGVETVICPPFVFLPVVRHAIHYAALGSQDAFFEEAGPFTGQVSPPQLGEFGVSHVIIGHSEKRRLGEGDSIINQKVRAVLKYGFHPVVCVGQGAKKGDAESKIKQICKKQLQLGLRGVNPSTDLTIAYEPVWAISHGRGTGQAATPEHAARILSHVRKLLPAARLIYGGSIEAKNSAKFAAEPIIQGGLVGGASLDAREFLSIIKSFAV